MTLWAPVVVVVGDAIENPSLQPPRAAVPPCRRARIRALVGHSSRCLVVYGSCRPPRSTSLVQSGLVLPSYLATDPCCPAVRPSLSSLALWPVPHAQLYLVLPGTNYCECEQYRFKVIKEDELMCKRESQQRNPPGLFPPFFFFFFFFFGWESM